MSKLNPTGWQSQKQATSDQIKAGLATGKAIIQNPEVSPMIFRILEDLINEGIAVATPWKIHPKTGERYRIITARPLKPNERVIPDEPTRSGRTRARINRFRTRGS